MARVNPISPARTAPDELTSPMTPVAPSHTHRLALLQTKPTGQLLLHEIYRSVQGESTFAGLPCVFVRTAVCDARCHWCDSPHAFNQGTAWQPDDVFQRVLS